MTTHNQGERKQKNLAPLISAFIAAFILISGIITSYAINTERISVAKIDLEKHCTKQEIREQRTDEKLDKVLDGIARLETKVEVLQQARSFRSTTLRNNNQ